MLRMLARPIQDLVEKLKNHKNIAVAPSGDDSFINVNKITEKAGAFYEKVRYLVDYKDEHHIRRSAIERIVKRKIVFEGGQAIALSLVQELIAGKYLANNSIAESTVAEVENIVQKYITLGKYFPADFARSPRARSLLVSLTSCELEEFFYPNVEDELVALAYSATIADNIKIETTLSPSQVNLQVSLACFRSLLNSDDETLRYKLWLKFNPGWSSLSSEADIADIGKKSFDTSRAIHEALNDPLSFKLLPKLSNYAIYFAVIREIVRAYGAESERVFSDQKMLEEFASKFLLKNYKQQYAKTRDSAVRAVFYIFCTKILLALALEVPYELYILKNLNYLPLGLNIAVHPLLLLCVTLSVGRLGEDNTKKIISGVMGALDGEHTRLIKVNAERVSFFTLIFYALYAIMFLIIFGAIVWGLSELRFSIVSMLLFLCFLALVSYFALRIRHSANKWRIKKENDKIVSLLFNLFALPIISVGKWLSRKFSSINLFVFVLDFIIETPFKFLLHFSDAFVSFLKEKQDDVY